MAYTENLGIKHYDRIARHNTLHYSAGFAAPTARNSSVQRITGAHRTVKTLQQNARVSAMRFQTIWENEAQLQLGQDGECLCLQMLSKRESVL